MKTPFRPANLIKTGILGLLLGTLTPALAIDLERVEPPHWFIGYKSTELQIMLFGENIAGASVQIDSPGVSLKRRALVSSPNYQFLYLDIAPETPPGDIEIVLQDGTERQVFNYPLRAKNPNPAHGKGFDTSDAIYLITPDRFVNGNTANDNDPALGDKVDRSELCGRHGGDIAGIRQALPYIADQGYTAIWLNPVLENRMPRCSYHGYSTTDFYAADPRYGSNEEYRELAEQARAMGIGLIMDMIVNHIGSGHWWMDDLPSQDWLNSVEDRPITNHMHATVMDPYASEYDLKAFADGWFVDTMPDLNQRNKLLADYLIQNALWWIEELGLAGIRMDTHPYPDRDYMGEWTRRVMEEYPAFNIVGEEWNDHPVIVSYWQRGKVNRDGYKSYLPSLMDFPLQQQMAKALVAPAHEYNSSWKPLYETLAMDTVYPDPSGLVIFPDNHDMSRIFTQLEEDMDLFRMAMVFVTTMRGTPQIYYGTEILMANRASTDHGLIRSDFPGGWPGDERNAFTGEGMGENELAAQALVRELLQWRKDKPVIHQGQLMQFAPFGEIYSYFRYNDDATVMVVFNKHEESKSLAMNRYAERLRGAVRARDVLTGETLDISGSIELAPRSTLLLEIQH